MTLSGQGEGRAKKFFREANEGRIVRRRDPPWLSLHFEASILAQVRSPWLTQLQKNRQALRQFT